MAGFILYAGPSELDGAPIAAIAILASSNRKTGAMLQTYILRADVSPTEASRTGADASVCGDCPHRGRADGTGKIAAGRSCYVNLGQGPSQVYKTLTRGAYPVAGDVAEIGAGRMIRIGTYGDPAAVPAAVWTALLSRAAGHTGYSHQWRTAPSTFTMASVDSAAEAHAARAAGHRTFRVLADGESPERGAEILCPSLKGIQCVDCGLCSGAHSTARSIAIPAHGAGRKYVNIRAVA